MAEEIYDPYETDDTAGLPDDFDGEIAEWKWTYDGQYADGTQLIAKVVLLTDPEDPNGVQIKDRDGTIGQQTLFLSTGKGWEQDGPKGEVAVLVDPTKRPQFKSSSKVGMFLNAALELGAGDVMRSRGLPMAASTWIGLSFHWKRKTHDYGGEIGKTESLMPTAFLGVREASGKVAAPAKAAAKAGAKTETKAETAAAPALSGRLKAQLMTLAADSADHEAFVEAALQLEGVNGNDAAQSAVMAAGDGSIWAEAHS